MLITTITIGAVAAAYLWGTPLLEKQQQRSQVTSMEGKMNALRNTAERAASSGSGTVESVTLDLGGGSIRINESHDILEIETEPMSAPYPENNVLLYGTNLQNVTGYGGDYALKSRDDPGVVLANSGASAAEYRIEFRALRSEDEIEQIDLVRAGRPIAQGDVTVSFKNLGPRSRTRRIAGESFTYERRRLEVRLD